MGEIKLFLLPIYEAIVKEEEFSKNGIISINSGNPAKAGDLVNE